MCEVSFIIALKAKLEAKSQNGDNYDNCISEAEQADISGDIEMRLDRFNLAPPEPGQVISLSHVTDDIRLRTEVLLNQYESSFASHRFDTGTFNGFSADIEITPGASVIEKERPMRANIKNELKPMIQDLLKENIIKKADFSGPFLSNSHGVAKPDKKQEISGKTDLYLLAQSGVATNHSRLTLDLRNLNRHCVGKPKINLPSHRDLIHRFANHNITTIDLCSQYWAISTDYSCQHLSNFWYDHQVYAFTSYGLRKCSFHSTDS